MQESKQGLLLKKVVECVCEFIEKEDGITPNDLQSLFGPPMAPGSYVNTVATALAGIMLVSSPTPEVLRSHANSLLRCLD